MVVPGNLAPAKSHQTPLAMTVTLLEVMAFVFSAEAQPLGTCGSSLIPDRRRKPCSESQLHFRPVHLQTAHVWGPSMAPPTTTSSLTVFLPEPKPSATTQSQHSLFRIKTAIKMQALCQHKLLQMCTWSQRTGVRSSRWSRLPYVEALEPLPSITPLPNLMLSCGTPALSDPSGDGAGQARICPLHPVLQIRAR